MGNVKGRLTRKTKINQQKLNKTYEAWRSENGTNQDIVCLFSS